MRNIFNSTNNSVRNKFIKNTIWLVMERVFQMFISLIVGMLAARYLGPSNYGLINYSLSIVALFTSICTLGLESVLIKEIIDNKDKSGEILGTGIFMRTLSGIISIFLSCIAILILQPGDKVLLTITLLQSISLVFKASEIIDIWFQSRLQSRYVVIAKTSASIMVVIWKVILLMLNSTVQWFALSITIDAFIVSIILSYLYFRNNGQMWRCSYGIGKRLIKQSYHFIISGLLVSVYTQVDKIMLGQLLNTESVGIYSVASTIANLWFFIPMALINSARPIIIDSKKVSNDLYIKRLKQLYALLIWIGIAVSITFTILSKEIVLILYGVQYLNAVVPLKIITWSGIFALLGTARNIWIICEGFNKYAKYYVGLGSVVSIILNIIFIKSLGIVGVAISSLITQFIVAIVSTIFKKETRVSSKIMIEAFLLKGVFK